MAKDHTISRREFIKVTSILGSGFAIGFNSLVASKQQTSNFSPDTFINVLSDETIVLSVAKAEMGQGIWTSLPMLIAEEMEANWDNIKVKQTSKDSFMGTGGSMSIKGYGWEKMRKSGAIAKYMLIEAAALKWKVSPLECDAKNSEVMHKLSGKKASYGSLVKEASKIKIPRKVKLKDPSHFSLLGKDMLRTDSKMKVDGSALFAMDVNLKGMLYAMVERPKYFGSTFKNSNADLIKKEPGIIDVFNIPSGVAVVGKNMWSIIKARNLLQIDWEKKKNPVNADSNIYKRQLFDLVDGKSSTVKKKGKPSKFLSKSKNTFEAKYYLPFQTHAAMEPCNCVVNVSKKTCEIWAGTQNPSNAISRAANVTGLDDDKIKLNLTFLGGGFGRKSFNDFIEDAVHISKKIKSPIKLIFSREDDIKHGFARPASIHKLTADLDGGDINVWKHVVVSPDPLTGNALNEYGADLPGIAKWAVNIGVVKNKLRNTMVADGASEIPYNFHNKLIKASPFETDVPLGFWRAVFNSQNAFANECFIDELADQLKIDPIQLRLNHLNNNSRSSIVIRKAAKESGWKSKLPKGHFQGFAYHHSFGTHVAQVAEISIDSSNQVKVHKVVSAVDCGQTVNPMTIRAQIQGSIIFGLGATIKSEMTVKNGRVNEGNFDDYQVIRMDETPEVYVHIIENQEGPGGVGEPGLPPIAPAIANAVFAASGKRIRKLPILSKDLS
ncbi:MAG: hypothetical protein CBB66_05455 [bacterium TMED6]|nr:MAG: hypothetical protein CBB66_05455 [bacterium TMED6]